MAGARITGRFTFGRPKSRTPSARAGAYRSPVDTTGMDAEMKRTLEVDDDQEARFQGELKRLRNRKPTRRPG